MPERNKPNIHRPKCAEDCRFTVHNRTLAARGDVRLCEHFRIWKATGRTVRGYFYNELDGWERLSLLWTPIQYHRAFKALHEAGEL